MDVGLIIPAAMIAVGGCGLAAYMWRTRRPAPPVVVDPPSHVRTVVPQIVSAGGSVREEDRGSCASPAPAGTSSLAVEAWASIAGGTEWEAKLATAQRRIAQSSLFGDAALRRTAR